MNTIKVRNALIATHNLIDYGGSEVFTLELATELREMGWTVWTAAFKANDPMLSEFRQAGFQIVDLLEDNSVIRRTKFDLAWIHHTPVFYELFITHKIDAAMIIFCSLSPFEPLEAIPVHRENINFLLANSIENRNHIARDFDLDDSQVGVFQNAVPSIYWNYLKNNHNQSLMRVAVISNHPPPEILEAVAILKRHGVEVIHIGIGGEQILLRPSHLLSCDMAITIGKTIPYCFALKVPVYCYDHFGGPGWLNSHNLYLASEHNFSGRGFLKKTPTTICHEIIKGYSESMSELDALRMHAEIHHNLRKNLRLIFERPKITSLKQLKFTVSNQTLTQHSQYMRLIKSLRACEAELVATRAEISRVKSTFSWQITKPLRFVWNTMSRLSTLRTPRA